MIHNLHIHLHINYYTYNQYTPYSMIIIHVYIKHECACLVSLQCSRQTHLHWLHPASGCHWWRKGRFSAESSQFQFLTHLLNDSMTKSTKIIYIYMYMRTKLMIIPAYIYIQTLIKAGQRTLKLALSFKST